MGQPELSGRRRYLVLAICCISLFIVGIDATIVNVALPSIQRDLHAPVSGLQWIVDAYTLVLASLLMLSGSTRGPGRAAADLPDWSRRVHARIAAVQPGTCPGLAGRVPRAPGHRRVDAQPGGTVDYHEHVYRPHRAGPRDRGVGRRVRHQHGARPDRRRGHHRLGRLAGDLLGQHPHRRRGDHPDRAVRPRVPGAAGSGRTRSVRR
jgi:hypothetical protein